MIESLYPFRFFKFQRSVLIFFFVLVSLLSFCAKAQITSDFNSSADGWTCFDVATNSSQTVNYSSTGGNPSGNVSCTTPSTNVQLFWTAPAKFNGNLSLAYNQNLTFDLQLPQSGTDNSQGDIIISNSVIGITLVYQLPKPLNASWTNFVVPLLETAGWKWGNIFGTAATKDQMKQVLVNVTTLRIRMKYTSGNPGTYTGQLDNVILNTSAIGTPPVITSFSPASGVANTTVTITGTNFNTTPTQNAVYFGGIEATVTSSTATQLKVKSPGGAPNASITVINLATGLLASSQLIYTSQYDNNKDYGGRIIPASMTVGHNTTIVTNTDYNSFGGLVSGDFDNDGGIDLVTTETGTKKVFVYRNLVSTSPVSASSFAASPVTLTGPVDGELTVGDFDGDGKLDIAGLYQGGGSTEYFAVFRNTSTSGNISFASSVIFPMPNYSAFTIQTSDIDGDGRLDLLATNGSSGSYLWIAQNLSSPGNIDFAAAVSYGASAAYSRIVAGDLNGDGKKEVIVSHYSSNQLLIFPNASTPGTLSLATPFTVTPTTSTLVDTRLLLTDLDQDSKLDIAWCGYGSTNLFIMKNIYSGGALDATVFASDVVIPSKIDHPTALAAGDINSDGKLDIVAVGFSDMAIFQSNVTAGAINSNSFVTGVVFEGAAAAAAIYATGPVIADFDGDNKPEVIMGYSNSAVPAVSKAIHIFRNECFPAPQISSLNSTAQNANTSLTLTGKYLNTNFDTPLVRTQGLTTNAGSLSNTNITTTTPAGAISNRVGVTLHGLTGYSSQELRTTFSPSTSLSASTFASSVDYTLSSGAYLDGLNVGDFDNDGKPDIIIDDNYVGKIYRNTMSSVGIPITSGTFTVLSNKLSYGYHCTASDFDGDGKIDVAVNGSVYQNNTGTQPEAISFTSSIYASFNNVNRFLLNHDFNLDGKLDVVTSTSSNQINISENFTNKGTMQYSTLFGSFGATFNIATGVVVAGVTAADYDGDGFDDIAFGVSGGSPNLSVLRNTGLQQVMTSSQFASVITFTAGVSPQYIISTDFDGDGKIDIALGNNGSTFVSVYRNTSSSGVISFVRQDITSPKGASGIDAADLDGDGKMEIVLINQLTYPNGSFSIFKNNSTSGTISFGAAMTNAIAGMPSALAIADINLDSKPDIVIEHSSSPNAILSIYENKLSFAPVISVNTQPSPIAVCDGATTSLSTSASGTTNITYQWQIFDSNSSSYVSVTNNTIYSGTSTSMLSINTTGNSGAGQYRCRIDGDLAVTVYTNAATVTVNALPLPPSASDVVICKTQDVTLTASGASNGQYRWYDGASSIIGGAVNSQYTATNISASSTFYVSINNGTCESTQKQVSITFTPLTKPVITSAPVASGNVVTICDGQSATLSAPTGFNYTWSDAESTQNIMVTQAGNFTMTVSDNGGCVSPASDAITVTINDCDQPPVIQTTTAETHIEGSISINLLQFISDPDNNLDLSTLKIIIFPISGAQASIDADHNLIIDYTNVSFSGRESITIEVCDLKGKCSQQTISLDIAGDIVVFNAFSPNGDTANPAFYIEYINVIEDTKHNHVSIFNRWGDVVFEIDDYDNINHVFTGQNQNGNDLPAGNYFYKIDFSSGKKSRTGFVSIKR